MIEILNKFKITYKIIIEIKYILKPLFITSILLFNFFIFSGCPLTDAPGKLPADNPLDPENPEYIPPQTGITGGPEEGETVRTHYVTFSWRGNEVRSWSGEKLITEYRYRLDDNPWSSWISDTAATFYYLDDLIPHKFEVTSRYASGAMDETPAKRNFNVDAVRGPAIMFFPRHKSIAAGDTFSLEIMAEEVLRVAGVKVDIKFDPAFLAVRDLKVYDGENAFLAMFGGVIIPFYKYDNTGGEILIEVAIATGNPPDVFGTGALGKVTFTAMKSGRTFIEITDKSEYRTPENKSVFIRQLVKGVIDVR